MARLVRFIPVLALVACVPQQAPRPSITRDADPCSKQHTYDAYQLTYHDSMWAPKWTRADGEYTLPALNDVFESYPKTRDVAHRTKVRNTVVGSLVGLGAGLAAGTLTYNLTAPPASQMSSNAQLASYGIAGGLVVVGLLTALVWSNPVDHIAETYNAELHEDLSPGACAR